MVITELVDGIEIQRIVTPTTTIEVAPTHHLPAVVDHTALPQEAQAVLAPLAVALHAPLPVAKDKHSESSPIYKYFYEIYI